MKISNMFTETATSLVLSQQANFNGVACDFYDDPIRAISKVHDRHKERLDRFSVVTKLTTTDGKSYDTYVYSEKGLYEICRWSRQPKADTFIDFVWNVVEAIRKNKVKPTLTCDELVGHAAQKVANQLFPQFVKTITPTLAKSIVDQVRSLPQGETLLPPQIVLQEPQVIQQAPQQTTIKKKRGKRIMNYTLHTWEIAITENGPVAFNKKEFETTDHSAIMARIKAIVGTGVQYVLNKTAVRTVAI